MVRIENSLSDPQTILAGCTPGSVLGPLLALMYLNDLSNHIDNEVLFYADDTSLYSSHPPDSRQHIQSLQRDLDIIEQYGIDWAITFNANKTVLQTFTNRRDDRGPELSFNKQLYVPHQAISI